MKKFVALLLVIMSLVLVGCDKPTEKVSSQVTTMGPAKEFLDLGTVTILYGGARLRYLDAKRQEQILKAVSERLLYDKGVRASFEAIGDINLAGRLKLLIAAGSPPSICYCEPKITTNAEMFDNLEINPLPLNIVLDQYGQNLLRDIPEYLWDLVIIKDKIMEIPQLKLSITMPVLNENVLLKEKWSNPSTEEEFENLLELAKANNLYPIVSQRTFSSSMPWLHADRESTIINDGDEFVHYFASKQYLEWLQQQRKWIDKGWLIDISMLTEEELQPDSGKWLCSEMTLDELTNTANVVILPPLSNGGDIPVYPPMFRSPYSFKSYDKPEALVILFDWMITTEANNRLISLGEEGKDYRMINDSEYEWIDGPSWPGSNFFPISALYRNPHFARINSKAYDETLDIYERYSQLPISLNLPGGAVRYRKTSSRLDVAINNELKFHTIAMDAQDKYLSGVITLTDYQTILDQNKSLIDDYIKIIKDLKANQYNIWDDVYQP